MPHYCADLPQEALLHITGPDALSFLQGQVTCDTRLLSGSRALPGVYCSVQGRVACDFLLVQLAAEHIALRMRRDILADSSALFGKYIIFSKARLDAVAGDWVVLACWGPQVADALGSVLGATPGARYAAVNGDGFCLVQLDEDGQQFECYLDGAQRPELPGRLKSALQPGTAAAWNALQVRSGVARLEAATAGRFVPQNLNYDLTGHISFNKGCYTGQEVVARLHYRGKPKRRLYLASLAAEAAATGDFAVAAPLFRSGAQKPEGEIVNCSAVPGQEGVALLSATAGGAAGGLHLAHGEGPELQPLALPYPLPEG